MAKKDLSLYMLKSPESGYYKLVKWNTKKKPIADFSRNMYDKFLRKHVTGVIKKYKS